MVLCVIHAAAKCKERNSIFQSKQWLSTERPTDWLTTIYRQWQKNGICPAAARKFPNETCNSIKTACGRTGFCVFCVYYFSVVFCHCLAGVMYVAMRLCALSNARIRQEGSCLQRQPQQQLLLLVRVHVFCCRYVAAALASHPLVQIIAQILQKFITHVQMQLFVIS